MTQRQIRLPDYYLDIGKGTNQIVMLEAATNIITILSRQDVLELPFTLPTGSYVVGENSHFGVARSPKSRSQYYFDYELGPLYRNFLSKDILFKLLPEKLTPRANARNEIAKDTGKQGDINDVKGWCKLLTKHPTICLKTPNLFIESKPISPLVAEGWMYRKETGWILNGCRSHTEAYANADDMILQYLNDIIDDLWHEFSDKTKFMLGWPLKLEHRNRVNSKENEYGEKGWLCGRANKEKNLKKGDIVLKNVPNMKALYTLASMFLDSTLNDDGNIILRTRKDNPYCADQQPGIDFLMTHVVANTAFHLKGGVARSNIYFWWMRNRIKRVMAMRVFNTKNPETWQVSAMGCKRRDGNFGLKGSTTITLMDGKTKKYLKDEYMPETKFTDDEDAMFIELRTQGRHAIQEILRIFKKKTKAWVEERNMVEERQNLPAQLELV